MNHVDSKNHTIDWEGVRLPAKEPDWKKRGGKEAIFIRKAGMRANNQDWGCHHLPEVFSKLLYQTTRLESRGIFVALMKGPVWSGNILAGKTFLPNSPYP